MTDEHYYRSVDEFLHLSPGYATNYDRRGPEIFVGEWAAHETSFPPWDQLSRGEPPTPNLWAAIGDSAFMAAMERHSDLIKMQCYAPLLVNVNPGARQWRPDLIGYNAISAYGSPSYYAIRMFSRNLGDEILPVAWSETQVQGSATLDRKTGELFLKLVNPEPVETTVHIDIKGTASLAAKGQAITLSGSPQDTNSISRPRNVVPLTTTVRHLKPQFDYVLPADSIVVLKLKAAL
jgi:alpha-N-arabinofuranosidase